MAEPRQSHDRLRRKSLRQFHAALVGCSIGVIEVDVGQLLCTAQRTAFDSFDLNIPRPP
ncbi:hypothetical protein [Bradyrhizobium sp. CCBAU 051011]|uniref:hypothetical protein n=1 Tax=Bradyrhizobium sp. CCBAU 051011 TaxID=858422 RepID=UPI001379F131|nr:hypothetical protein [Bradyrhizobium sp. CCBAU 051011]